MAGGAAAFVKAAEGAEDNARAGEEDLKSIGFGEQDALVGIAASGRTPYVLGGMAYAKGLGAVVIGLSCTRNARIAMTTELATLQSLRGAVLGTGGVLVLALALVAYLVTSQVVRPVRRASSSR